MAVVFFLPVAPWFFPLPPFFILSFMAVCIVLPVLLHSPLCPAHWDLWECVQAAKARECVCVCWRACCRGLQEACECCRERGLLLLRLHLVNSTYWYTTYTRHTLQLLNTTSLLSLSLSLSFFSFFLSPTHSSHTL